MMLALDQSAGRWLVQPRLGRDDGRRPRRGSPASQRRARSKRWAKASRAEGPSLGHSQSVADGRLGGLLILIILGVNYGAVGEALANIKDGRGSG